MITYKILIFYVNCVILYLSKAFSQANLFTLKWVEVVMTISKVPGYVWPLDIECKTCGVTFTLHNPTDMLRHIKYNYKSVDGMPVPSEERRFVTAACPCCKTEHELQPSQVPAIFGAAIPLAPGEGPICNW